MADDLDSPDVLVAAGVKRLNRRPLLIVTGLGLMVTLALLYAVQKRAAATRPKSPESQPRQEQTHVVVDSASTANDLVKDVPQFGEVPASFPNSPAPELPSTPSEGARAFSSTPAASTSAAAHKPTRKPALTKDPLDAESLNRLRLAEQRQQQVMDAAFSAPTRVAFTPPSIRQEPPQASPQQILASLANANRTDPAALMAAAQSAARQATAADPNFQDSKEAFAEKIRSAGYLPSTRTAPISRFELKLGAVIPAIMVSGINSDLPGQIVAQVSQNVYDTATGRHLLIPQGSKLFGVYDSRISYGQNRVLVAWTRLTYPDASSLDLGGMSGADQAGYGGFADQVNNHFLKIYGASLMMSAISAGTQLSQPQPTGNSAPSASSTAAAAVGQELGQTSAAVLQKNVNVQPTLIIRPGYRFAVMVSKDIAFPTPYRL